MGYIGHLNKAVGETWTIAKVAARLLQGVSDVEIEVCLRAPDPGR
jgi:hypothetical protein